MTSQQLIQDLENRTAEIKALSTLWKSSGLPVINDGQMGVWLDLHPFDRVVHAIKRTARTNVDSNMSLDHAVRYCSKVANGEKTHSEKVGPNDRRRTNAKCHR